ncbi:hypothetical protein CC80DRAFT_588967 [Byssothecium circinans]|uniref:Uncharacterized protein n=1 Tax=Byssothecium circinans TaxID=147558 RepID=A0A6A5UMX5_9PLEO|nr:hypothetical protein CC80DRAFT_588967 [Byssothecium circinans]
MPSHRQRTQVSDLIDDIDTYMASVQTRRDDEASSAGSAGTMFVDFDEHGEMKVSYRNRYEEEEDEEEVEPPPRSYYQRYHQHRRQQVQQQEVYPPASQSTAQYFMPPPPSLSPSHSSITAEGGNMRMRNRGDGDMMVAGIDPETGFEYDYDGRVMHIHRGRGRESVAVQNPYTGYSLHEYTPYFPGALHNTHTQTAHPTPAQTHTRPPSPSPSSVFSEYITLDAQTYNDGHDLAITEATTHPQEENKRKKVAKFVKTVVGKLEGLGWMKKLMDARCRSRAESREGLLPRDSQDGSRSDSRSSCFGKAVKKTPVVAERARQPEMAGQESVLTHRASHPLLHVSGRESTLTQRSSPPPLPRRHDRLTTDHSASTSVGATRPRTLASHTPPLHRETRSINRKSNSNSGAPKRPASKVADLPAMHDDECIPRPLSTRSSSRRTSSRSRPRRFSPRVAPPAVPPKDSPRELRGMAKYHNPRTRTHTSTHSRTYEPEPEPESLGSRRVREEKERERERARERKKEKYILPPKPVSLSASPALTPRRAPDTKRRHERRHESEPERLIRRQLGRERLVLSPSPASSTSLFRTPESSRRHEPEPERSDSRRGGREGFGLTLPQPPRLHYSTLPRTHSRRKPVAKPRDRGFGV